MAPRNDFLNQQAPENYVAGLGRGATGFTTRSDLGPAREGPSEEQIKEALAKRAAQLGTSASSAYGATGKKPADEEDDDAPDHDPENEVGLFASGNYDRDDDEADRIYQEVDEKMEKRRRIRREAREKKEREEYEAKNPKISQQFADLKRPLGALTDEDWASIPEVGDLTGKNKRQKQNQRQRFYAVPDSVIASAQDSTQFETSISEDGTTTTNGDNADGTMTNFADIGQARNKVLQVRLDQQANQQTSEESSGTSTSVDPKGYLTSLSKSELESGEVQLGDIKRVRTLLESVTKTNPKHAPGWVARCRLEEVAGRIVYARNIIAQGCTDCPKSEDCWSENIRLNSYGDNHNAKVIAANALKQLPESVRLWTIASDLESDNNSKKRVLMTALDHNTRSVALWKELINLSDRESALLLLSKATSEIQISVDLWLAYARLAETPEQAQTILNKARKAVPTSHEIWISAARLQEQMEQGEERINQIMRRAIHSLVRESAGAMLKREEWIVEAEKCEQEGAILTCGAIVRETLGYSLDEDDDRKEIWLQDARDCISHERFATARYIYAYLLRVFPTSRSAYAAAIDFEREHGTEEALDKTLSAATEACPQVEEFWIDLAKQRRGKSLDESRRVLATAFQRMAGNENIWLSACDLESEAGQISQARDLLATARREAGTDRVYIKSVAFERIHAEPDTPPTAALDLVSEGLSRYPKAAKLHMMKGQIYEHDCSPPRTAEARKSYSDGIRACPNSVPLTLLLSRLEERAGVLIKARSVLERSAIKHALIWRERVRIERRAGNLSAAQNLMARALQDVPAASSGPLWTERIWYLEARNQRKPLALEAIKKVESDPQLFVAVARIFWAERRLEKAASWFEKAVLLDPDVGDTWGWYLKFLRMHGTAEKRADVVAKCVGRAPKHGEVWAEVNKDPKNAGKSVEQVLELVIEKLE